MIFPFLHINPFKYIENNDSVFVITEFYPGGDISTLIRNRVKQKNPLSIWEVKILMRSIMSAIAMMHK